MIAAILTSFFISGAFAEVPKPVKSATPVQNIPEVLKLVEAKYAKAGTLVAKFSESVESLTTKTKKVSSGTIMIKRPNKVRWETKTPDPNLLVSDGKTFWNYTPPFDETEPGQLIERKTSQVQSQLANALLSGNFSMSKNLKITQKSALEFLIVPKPGTAAGVKQALIRVNARTQTIEKVVLVHKGGNKSEISLQEIQLGKSLEDDLFHFTPPANTDRVKE
ncbi:outer membrane lipoprotein chaperone LolA [bacterium]|jgi:outer membrane lipoprotein carrier protein|nr:outer membrane lipoprotein chaperone LolA [bacterium]